MLYDGRNDEISGYERPSASAATRSNGMSGWSSVMP